jgi:diaphanous 2
MILEQLSSTKDIENKQTLTHYLFETVEKHYPDCLRWVDDLFYVEAAAKVSPESIQKALRQMESNIKGLETDIQNSKQLDPNDKFLEVMGVRLYSR